MNTKAKLLLFFTSWLALTLIVGGITGFRFSNYYQVECTKLVNCPSGSIFDSKSNCISLLNLQGLVSTGIIENHDGLSDFPITCWTNGIHVTAQDPRLVFIICSSICVLGWLGYFCISLSFCNKSKPSSIANSDDEHEWIMCCNERECIRYCGCNCMWEINFLYWVKWIVFIIVCLWLIAISINVILFELPYSKVQCLGYALDDTKTYVSKAVWNDTNGRFDESALYMNGYLPTQLPAACWIGGNGILFSNPTLVYINITASAIFIILGLYQPSYIESLRCLKCAKKPYIQSAGDEKRIEMREIKIFTVYDEVYI